MRLPTLLAIALVAGGGIAVAQPMAYGHHHEGQELFDSAGLTDAQKAQIRQIEQAAWAQAKPVMERMHSVHEQIASRMLAAGNVTETDLAPLVQQEESLRTQLDTIHMNALLKGRALLSPDQLAQAATKHQQLEALHEQEHQLMQPASAP